MPLDKFRFSYSQRPDADPSTVGEAVWILACPRSAAIAKHLGYSSLLLRVDPDKRIVHRVEYADLAGRPLKVYGLLQQTELGDRHFPKEVRLQHFSEGFVTTLHYEYWLPENPPPSSLFVPKVETDKFIQRLKAYVSEAGLGERIELELAEADERLREFEARLRRMPGGEAATRGILPLQERAIGK